MGNKINIQQLNTDFGIANQIEFVAGKGGLPCIQINNEKASALISIYAGQVLSFQPVNEPEDFLSVNNVSLHIERLQECTIKIENKCVRIHHYHGIG